MDVLIRDKDLGRASVVLRLGMAMLFGVNAFNKFTGTRPVVLDRFEEMFRQSGLPPILVTAVASTLPFVETGLAVWLFSGFRLKDAWTAVGLVLVGLSFGMLFIEQYAFAADNFHYLLIVVAGLACRKHDPWQPGS